MAAPPPWLPTELQIPDRWEEALGVLFGIFVRDFVRSMPLFLGKRVLVDKRRIDDLREEGFWHLISKDTPNVGRVPDYARARRIVWIRPMIEHADEPEVRSWSSQERTPRGRWRLRSYIWLESQDFVVVLECRKKPEAFLVTAYCVEGARAKRKLHGSFERRVT